MIKITLLIHILLILSATNCEVPKSDADLIKGFLEGSGLNTFLNIKSCQSDFDEFLSFTLATVDSAIDNSNNAITLYNAGQTLASFSKLLTKCEGTEAQIQILKDYSLTVYRDPQMFLQGVLSNLVSIHIVSQYIGLKGKIEKRQFYEVGKVFGDIISYAVKIRDQLHKKGAESLRSTGKIFRSMYSYDGKSKVSREEFLQWFKEIGVVLPKSDYETLILFFDRDSEGCCNFEEFLSGIRGKPNLRRQAIVDKAFLKFDKEGNGVIDVISIRQVFNCAKHPKIVSGEMTEEQVFATFLKNFNDVTGKIDRSEWNDYYSAVSASIDNDDHFVILMKTAWNLE